MWSRKMDIEVNNICCQDKKKSIVFIGDIEILVQDKQTSSILLKSKIFFLCKLKTKIMRTSMHNSCIPSGYFVFDSLLPFCPIFYHCISKFIVYNQNSINLFLGKINILIYSCQIKYSKYIYYYVSRQFLVGVNKNIWVLSFHRSVHSLYSYTR